MEDDNGCGFPALIEEFAFRKVIFGVMRQYGFWVAAMFSSSMFGLMHQNIIQIVFAFGMGLIFCYLYERTGSIVYCMLLHFINNGVSVALPYISGYNRYGLYIEIIVGIISFTIAILGMCYATKKEMIKRWLRNMDCERVRCCFRSVPIILYTVFCIGMSVFTIWIIIQEI